MAVSAQQQAQEQANEAKLNQLSEQIIGQTPWGKFYGLMRAAAALGEGAIPHQVCISKDGRTLSVYKTTTGKLVGSFLKPTHEVWTKYASQKDWKNLGISLFGATHGLPGVAQLQYFFQMQNSSCFEVKPSEVIALVNSVPSYDPATGQRKAGYVSNLSQPNAPSSATTKPNSAVNTYFTNRNILIGVITIGSAFTLLGLLKIAKVI